MLQVNKFFLALLIVWTTSSNAYDRYATFYDGE